MKSPHLCIYWQNYILIADLIQSPILRAETRELIHFGQGFYAPFFNLVGCPVAHIQFFDNRYHRQAFQIVHPENKLFFLFQQR